LNRAEVGLRSMRGAAFAEHRAEGRIGGRRKKLDDIKRREIARMFGVSPPTVSRIVAAHMAAGGR
jgi:hypothetical protein